MTRFALVSRACAMIFAGGSLVAITGVPAWSEVPRQVPESAEKQATSLAASGPAVLSISPLRLELDGAANGATVLLTNGSGRPLSVQSRLFSWNQTSGEDIYSPSSDLTISPSISSIPPGETQVVRVLRKGTATSGEKRYRLVVDQLPDPALARPGQAVTRIRFTVPMFVDRTAASPAKLTWQMHSDRIELVNTGGATAKIIDLTVRSADGRVIPVERNSLRYVLGSSSIAWPLENGCSISKVSVSATVDGQVINGEPALGCG